MELAKPHEFLFDLGSVLKDKITPFKGVVVARTQWLSNCNTYNLKSKELKDGLPQDSQNFDEPTLESTSDEDFDDLSKPEEFKFSLGSVLEDKITSFEGVVVARTQWVTNNTYCLKPQELKDGMPQNSRWFDEPMLRLMKEDVFEPVQKTGGPEREVPQLNR